MRAAAMNAYATLGFVVVARKLTKPGSDNLDPRVKRLEDPRGSERWRVINDLDRLDPAVLG
jgi:hypothetical protein